jgi:hypothetical protein
MKKEIEENNRRVKEQQERMMNYVSNKPTGPQASGPISIEAGIPLATQQDLYKGISNY